MIVGRVLAAVLGISMALAVALLSGAGGNDRSMGSADTTDAPVGDTSDPLVDRRDPAARRAFLDAQPATETTFALGLDAPVTGFSVVWDHASGDVSLQPVAAVSLRSDEGGPRQASCGVLDENPLDAGDIGWMSEMPEPVAATEPLCSYAYNSFGIDRTVLTCVAATFCSVDAINAYNMFHFIVIDCYGPGVGTPLGNTVTCTTRTMGPPASAMRVWDGRVWAHGGVAVAAHSASD